MNKSGRPFAVGPDEDGNANEPPPWSFDDLRAACRAQLRRPALADALGGLLADRVCSFSMPPGARLVEEEARRHQLQRRQRQEQERTIEDPQEKEKEREGERPATEAPVPLSAELTEADLARRLAERRGQDAEGAVIAGGWVSTTDEGFHWCTRGALAAPPPEWPGIEAGTGLAGLPDARG